MNLLVRREAHRNFDQRRGSGQRCMWCCGQCRLDGMRAKRLPITRRPGRFGLNGYVDHELGCIPALIRVHDRANERVAHNIGAAEADHRDVAHAVQPGNGVGQP